MVTVQALWACGLLPDRATHPAVKRQILNLFRKIHILCRVANTFFFKIQALGYLRLVESLASTDGARDGTGQRTVLPATDRRTGKASHQAAMEKVEAVMRKLEAMKLSKAAQTVREGYAETMSYMSPFPGNIGGA